MSDHYEIVISCFLKDDTPEDVLETLRWHLGLIEQRPAQLNEDTAHYQLLAPDPDSRLPGGEIARLRRQTRSAAGDLYAWGVYVRTCYPDDGLGEVLTILDLLAPHVSNDGYGGYMREVNYDDLSVFTFGGSAYEIARRHPRPRRRPTTYRPRDRVVRRRPE